MKAHWQKIKDHWSNLASREKRLVMIGGFAVTFFIIYQFIWMPLNHTVLTLRQQIVTNENLLIWMKNADSQIQKLTVNANKKTAPISVVRMLTFTQKEINQAGLKDYLTQLKQANNESVDIRFQKIPFDKLIKLLITLSKHQTTINQMTAKAISSPGLVDAEITLKFV